jgi:AcrR family transcriptional regulator
MPTSAQNRIQAAALRLFAEKGSTQITVSALALEAGIARGTVYNNIKKPHQLFESVATRLVDEMHQRIVSTFNPALDPAIRLANGIRFFIRRTHEEPTWGRFINRFAHSEESLKKLFAGPPIQDVLLGLSQKRYDFKREQLHAVGALIAGTVLSSMPLVLHGNRTWQEVGSDAAELVLRALGIASQEAKDLATLPLPDLPGGPS